MSGKRRKRPLECSLSFCSTDDSRWLVLRWIFLCVFVPLQGLFWSPDNRSLCEFCAHFPSKRNRARCFLKESFGRVHLILCDSPSYVEHKRRCFEECLMELFSHKWKFAENVFTLRTAKIRMSLFLHQICRNVSLHQLLTNGCSAVNGCRQIESPNS